MMEVTGAVPPIPAGTNVLVTGATGFTGAVLTRRLVQAGLAVRAIARPSSRLDGLRDLDVRWFRGNVFDEAVIAAAADGVQYIFHLAAAYREARHGDDYYRKVHVDSTRLLAGAALRQPAFKRFVHVSTIGVHGHIAEPPADEDTPFHPDDPYQVTKAEAEVWLRAFAAERHLPFTVIRPCAIYGPGDTRLLKLFRMTARRYVPVIGRNRGLYHLIHVEDLADIIVTAATHPGALGEVIIAGNAEPLALDRVVRTIADALGVRPRFVRLPAWPFFALATACEAVCRPLGIEPPLHRRRVAFFTKDRAFDTRKLRERLGFRCRYSNEEGLAQTARWYVDQGWIRMAGR